MQNELQTIFTPEHCTISENFIQRVQALLKNEGQKIKNYSVQSMSYANTESLQLEVNGQQITISIHTGH